MYYRLLLSFVLPIVALVSICWVLAIHFQTDAPHSVSIVGAGLMTFVSAFTWMQSSDSPSRRSSSLRSAIAAAIIVQYLVLVGIVACFGTVNGTENIAALTQTLVSSFTTIVGVVIAFYFGSSAYLEGRKSDKGDEGPSGTGPSDSK